MNNKKENAAGCANNQTARIIYSRQKKTNTAKGFDKAKFPAPHAVLQLLNIRYSPKSGAWMQVFCPFHADGQEQNPSLSMHAKNGHYKCHACGTKGGDVIAFYRAVTGAGFSDTLKALGVRHV